MWSSIPGRTTALSTRERKRNQTVSRSRRGSLSLRRSTHIRCISYHAKTASPVTRYTYSVAQRSMLQIRALPSYFRHAHSFATVIAAPLRLRSYTTTICWSTEHAPTQIGRCRLSRPCRKRARDTARLPRAAPLTPSIALTRPLPASPPLQSTTSLDRPPGSSALMRTRCSSRRSSRRPALLLHSREGTASRLLVCSANLK